MEYYFADHRNVSLASNELIIAGPEFEHITKVLRKRAGEEITVTDGLGNVYHCVILSAAGKKAVCRILGHQKNLFEPEIRLRLYLSVLKSRERFEFAVEKAVELGVSSIVPVITKNTVKKTDFIGAKYERIRNLIIRAMCQSQRCLLPEFGSVLNFDEMLKDSMAEENRIVMYEFSEDVSGTELKGKTAALLIGPEGGFDAGEIESLLSNGWKSRSLGSRKLRAETAVVVSVFRIINQL